MRVPRVLLLSACFLPLLFVSQAAGGIGRAPLVDLRTSEGSQRGALVFEEWTDRAGGDVCATGSADGPGAFPDKGLGASESGDAKFVFKTPLRPKRVEIFAWREVDANGEPVGEPEELQFVLTPRANDDGEIKKWRATFAATPPPDYYLRLYARWKPVCGGPRHMLRTFHLAQPAGI
jgi:hypothetical protein